MLFVYQKLIMPKSSAERIAAYRDRLKQNIEIPTCKCTRPLKGRLAQLRVICSACYKKTPDGRHKNWISQNQRRGREILIDSLESYGDWEKGGRAIAPDGSIGTIQDICSWVDGTVTAIVQFEDVQESFVVSMSQPLITS